MFDWLFNRKKRKQDPKSNTNQSKRTYVNRYSKSNDDVWMHQTHQIASSSVAYDTDNCSKRHDSSHSHSDSHRHNHDLDSSCDHSDSYNHDSDSSYDSSSSCSDSDSDSSSDD